MNMKHDNPVISLPHLTNEIVKGARKTKLCAYAVALEGWRRGLTLKWYTIDSGKFDNMITFGVNPPGRLFSLSSPSRTHYFFRTRGDKVSNEAVKLGSDKNITKQLLKEQGVPVPDGGKFTEEHTDEEIVQFAEEKMNFPLVLKPTDASLGNGVVTNIKTIEEFRAGLDYVKHTLGYNNLIVERYVPGEEYRVYVVRDQVIAAYNRLPANVIGDGVSTISELIDIKNSERRRNARLFDCLIELDEETLNYIQTAGYTLDSIPNKGEKILLKDKTNVSAGGDPVDVTDSIPDEMKRIAINAVKAMPDLNHGGVDIIVDLKKHEFDPVVIELNPTAQIGGILFPMEGKARDIPSAIVDFYFPETIGTETDRHKIYFDLNTVLEPLQNRTAEEVEVAPALVGEIDSKRYIITGRVGSSRYHQMIRREALDRNISGHIKKISNNQIEVIVAGVNKEDMNAFKKILTKDTELAGIKSIHDEIHNQPVKIGFEINEEFDPEHLKNVNSLMKHAEKNLVRMNKHNKQLKKEAEKIKLSRSWRYTEYLRAVRKRIKK